MGNTDHGLDDHASVEQLTADVVVLTSGGFVLAIERGWPPFTGCWALPGGYVDPGEGPLQAAVRELAEEAGVELDRDALQMIGTYDAPDRDPRGRYVTTAFLAIVPSDIRIEAGDDAADARWWPLDQLPRLAFDHADILRDGRAMAERLQLFDRS